MMLSVFKNATLLNGKGGQPVSDAILVIENNKIIFVGNSQFWQDKPEQQSIDLNGKWIIPGLIDCHIHMDLHGYSDTFQENLVDEKLRTLRAAKEMSDTLRAGFTTVRNVGTVNHIDFAVKAGIEAGYFIGPRIITAGKIITMTCSGTEYFAGMYRIADGVDECRKAAREQLKAGADMLKVMATGAVMNPGGVPGVPQLNVDEIRAVVEEGEKMGKHTAAHAHGTQGIINAVTAGVHTIEHGTMATDEVLETMASNKTYLIPTLSLHELFEAHSDQVPAFIVEKSRAMQEPYIEIVKKAVRGGVPVAMGTDAGTNYNYHGKNAAEIIYLVEKEIMTPLQAITAATKTAAEAIRMDHEIGTLEAGKLADFIILNNNPLDDIRILSKSDAIKSVYKNGKKAS